MVVESGSELESLLAALRPSEMVLRDWVSPQLDASMVDEVAAADYGDSFAEHRAGIEELRRVRRLPEQLAWHPEEVLALTRWSRVDGAKLGSEAAHRLHLMRLFCCVVLVRASTADASPVNSLTPLVESALELGPSAVEAAAGYVAWCRLHEPADWRDDPQARPVLTMALAALCAQVPTSGAAELVPVLVSTFADELVAALEEEGLLWSPRPVHELLKLTAMGETRRMWKSIADRCLPGRLAGSRYSAQLALLGQAVRGELAADATELRSLLLDAAQR